MQRLVAEFIGTFFLIFFGVGAALFTAAVPGVGIGLLGVALAFGLTVTISAYAIAPISGCHLNPAVTVGLAVAGRFPWNDVVKHIIAQCLGGVVGAFAVYCVAKGGGHLPDLIAGGFASNGFGEHSPGGFDMHSVMIAEFIGTLMFVFAILGATSNNHPASFAPICIGLALVVGHLALLHISNASLNPARSLATAVIAKGWAMDQLWVFIVAPIVGGAAGGWIYQKITA